MSSPRNWEMKTCHHNGYRDRDSIGYIFNEIPCSLLQYKNLNILVISPGAAHWKRQPGWTSAARTNFRKLSLLWNPAEVIFGSRVGCYSLSSRNSLPVLLGGLGVGLRDFPDATEHYVTHHVITSLFGSGQVDGMFSHSAVTPSRKVQSPK